VSPSGRCEKCARGEPCAFYWLVLAGLVSAEFDRRAKEGTK